QRSRPPAGGPSFNPDEPLVLVLLVGSSFRSCRVRGRQCRQVQVVHHHDLPLPGILRHHEIQQTPAIGPRISLGIHHAPHLPMHIHGRNVGTDQPCLDDRVALVTVLENGREHRRVELFNFGSPARAFAAPIGEVGILGEYCRERLRVMPVPRVHKPVHHSRDCLLICSNFRLCTQRQRQSHGGYHQTGQQKGPSESYVAHNGLREYLIRAGYDSSELVRPSLPDSLVQPDGFSESKATTPITYCIAFPYVGTPCGTRKSRVCPREDQSLCGYLEINCWANEMERFFDWSDFFGCSSVL